MKKQLIFISLLLFTLFSFAQEPKIIGVGKQFHETDTTRTFGIFTEDVDLSLAILIEKWGEPVVLNVGRIDWENIEIDGIEGRLNIKIKDGYMSTPHKVTTFRTFKTEEQKTNVLSDLKEHQRRHTVLTIENQEGENIINTQGEEDFVVGYLLEVLVK